VGIATACVGVDIEKIHGALNVQRLAKRFFSPDEAAWFRNLPEAERILRFFRLWVLKEAYLKAIGAGVPAGLSKCEIALEAEGPRMLRSEFEDRKSLCALVEIPVSKGYVAALAVSRLDADVTVFDL
jgi:4'-phosphopantetheinyl transferase